VGKTANGKPDAACKKTGSSPEDLREHMGGIGTNSGDLKKQKSERARASRSKKKNQREKTKSLFHRQAALADERARPTKQQPIWRSLKEGLREGCNPKEEELRR